MSSIGSACRAMARHVGPFLLAICLVLPSFAWSRTRKGKARKVPQFQMSLFNVNTKERIEGLKVVGSDTKNENRQYISKKVRDRLKHFFRDPRSGRAKAIADRLLWNLYLTGQHFDSPMEIVSGYRSNERASSRHAQGKAIDFYMPGVDSKEIWAYCKQFSQVGCGYYPQTGFVHMDVREKSYFWIDDSGPGEAPDYRDDVAQNDGRVHRRANLRHSGRGRTTALARSSDRRSGRRAATARTRRASMASTRTSGRTKLKTTRKADKTTPAPKAKRTASRSTPSKATKSTRSTRPTKAPAKRSARR